MNSDNEKLKVLRDLYQSGKIVEGEDGARERFKRGPEEVNAFRRRQRDTGWGYVFATSLIPFVGLYYAISRRTITPFLYYFIGSIIYFIVISIFILPITYLSEGFGSFLLGLAYIAFFPYSIYLVKFGIEKARDFAKFELKQIAKEDGMNKKDNESNSEFKTNIPADSNHSKNLRPKNTVQFLREKAEDITKSILKRESPRTNLSETEGQLAELKSMFDRDVISKEEYQAMRKKILGL